MDILKNKLRNIIVNLDGEYVYDSGLLEILEKSNTEEEILSILDITVDYKYNILRLRHTLNIYLMELNNITTIKETKKEILDNIVLVYKECNYDFDKTMNALYDIVVSIYKESKKSIS